MTEEFLLPVRQLCPMCGRDDLILIETLAPGTWRYTCSNARRHPAEQPYSWVGEAASKAERAAAEGKAAGLGLYDDLLLCLVEGEPFVEYGIVEFRYSRLRPKTFAQLIEDYSHTRLQRNKAYTVSSFIAATLGRLDDRAEAVVRWGRATGHWEYNEQISYWALPPGPSNNAERSLDRVCPKRGARPRHVATSGLKLRCRACPSWSATDQAIWPEPRDASL